MRTSFREARRPRRGTTMVEAVVAMTLVGAILAVLVPILSRTQWARTENLTRERALSSVANLMDRAALLPTPAVDTLTPLASELTQGLEIAEPQWQFEVTPDSNSTLVQLRATLSWQTNKATRSAVSLVRWYPGGQP